MVSSVQRIRTMSCPEIHVAQKNGKAAHEAPPVLGQRATRQRRLIYDILRQSNEHMDVETLYRKARNLDERVSLSTVYRTISLLKEADLVDELVFEDDRRCYEFKNCSDHHHVRCQSCGEIVEFSSPCTEHIKQAIANHLGFQVDNLKIDVSGYCLKCKAAGTS